MRLLFKQRIFSWFDSYDIYDENGDTVFTVKGELSLGHRLNIYDAASCYLATVKERVLTFLPKFELYLGNQYAGEIKKEFTFFRPKFSIDFNGWDVEGDFWEWDYQIQDAGGRVVATVSKELFHLSDTYVIDVGRAEDGLFVLMLVLAIDAEKCSRG